MSTALTSPPAADVPTEQAPPPVVADVETQFMHNYRVAAPVHGGSVVASVANGAGDVEVFTLADDGTIWNFFPDPASESGYNGVALALQASTFAVGQASDGRIVLFYTSVEQLRYVKETGLPGQRWSKPTTVALPPVPGETRIGEIYIDTIGGDLYIGVLIEYESAGKRFYKLAWATWDPAGPVFQKASVTLDSLCCTWIGNNAETAAFVCLHTIVLAYVVSTGEKVRYPMTGTFDAISAGAATDRSGNSQIVAILSDGNAYRLIGGGGQPYSWAQISRAMNFRWIDAVADAAGDVHALAVSGDNQLYHWQPDASQVNGFGAAAPIRGAVATAAVTTDDDGAIDVFAVGTAQSTLAHLFIDEQSTTWQSVQVEVPQGGQLEELITYTSDVALSDAAGAPLANVPVQLGCTEEAYVTVNGATFFVGPHRTARTSTNAAGVLSIMQPAGTLSIPALTLDVTGRTTSPIVLAQYAPVQEQLAATTGPQLMEQKLPDGQYLLAEQYRTPTTTDSLASTCQQCMDLPAQLVARVEPLPGRHRSNTGVGLLRAGSPADARRIAPRSADQHWRLSFAGGELIYADLTADAARALVAEWRATTESARGFFDWIGDIGDVLAGVIDGIVEIIDAVVTTVVDGVRAVIKFIADGVEYLFDEVLQFVEQAFDLLQTVWASVKVFFEELFKWLGFLFDWPDMVRTHEALAYTVDQYLGFMQGAVLGTQQIVDGGIETLRGEIQELFRTAITQIAGTSTLGGYDKANSPPSPEFSQATANNVVFNGTVDNALGATTSSALLAFDTTPFQAVIDALEEFVENVESTPAFGAALDYFKNLGGSPDEIFTQLLSALMLLVEGVLEVMLDGLKLIVDAVLGIVAGLIGQLRTLLNAEWRIPLVSDLYEWVTGGSKLTLLDLVALTTAIPTTIIYKAAYDKTPFPDGASVDAFKRSFDAQSMLAAAGFGPPSDLAAAESGGLLPPELATLMNVGCGVSTLFMGGFTAVIDAWPEESPKILNQATYGLGCTAQVCSLPWWSHSAAPDCTTRDGKQATLWIVGNVGLTIDGLFLVVEDRLPPQWSDAGSVVTFCFGVGHLAMAIIASIGNEPLDIAGNIVPVVPELSKLLRLKAVVEPTAGISLGVLAAVDALFYTTAGVIAAITPAGGPLVAELELR